MSITTSEHCLIPCFFGGCCFLWFLSVSLQQNGAETQANPGPAGSDSDAEKCFEWDQRGETPVEQQYAEMSAAGRPVCGVHHWNPVPNSGYQGLCSFTGFCELLLFRYVTVNVSVPFRKLKNSCFPCLLLWKSCNRKNRSCWVVRGRSRKRGRRRWERHWKPILSL